MKITIGVTDRFQKYGDISFNEEDLDSFLYNYTDRYLSCVDFFTKNSNRLTFRTGISESDLDTETYNFDINVNNFDNTVQIAMNSTAPFNEIDIEMELLLTDDLLQRINTIAYYIIKLDKYNKYKRVTNY